MWSCLLFQMFVDRFLFGVCQAPGPAQFCINTHCIKTYIHGSASSLDLAFFTILLLLPDLIHLNIDVDQKLAGE